MREQTILLSSSPSDQEKLLQGLPPTNRVYKLVLTGGPCGGKTTAQSKLATFFESVGWKVFRVPETATVLMSGGIAFGNLNEEQIMDFQENLVRTMIAIEDTYFSMAAKSGQNCLVICDRGLMDASAFISRQKWEELLEKLQLEEFNLCEGRYDNVVHMVSAAVGAEDFYTVEDHSARFEGLELARERDRRAMEAWEMHPYVDIVDNRGNFDSKVKHLVDIVVRRIGLEIGYRFKADARKVKFVVKGPLPPNDAFPKFNDFEIVHHYLQTGCRGIQSRVRKLGCRDGGRWTFTMTVRKPENKGQVIEVKTPVCKKDYENLLNHADTKTLPVYKTRRVFMHRNHQYQLDIYRDPCHDRCRGLMLLETFSTLPMDELKCKIPSFLDVTQEVTGDPAFSMFNLALKSEWTAKDFCSRLVLKDNKEEVEDAAEGEVDEEAEVMEAQQRFFTRFDNTSDYSSGNEM